MLRHPQGSKGISTGLLSERIEQMRKTDCGWIMDLNSWMKEFEF